MPVRPVSGAYPTTVTVYHGCTRPLTAFDPAFIGSGTGHDTHGPGFYFSSDPEDAARYGLDSPEGELLTCEVDVAALLPTGRSAPRGGVEWLIATSPDLAEGLEAWGEEPRAAFRRAVPVYQQHESAHDAFTAVSSDFYRDHAPDYLARLVAMGYTGSVSDTSAATHLVVFDPSAIRIQGRMPAREAFEASMDVDAVARTEATLRALARQANRPSPLGLQRILAATAMTGAPTVPVTPGVRRARRPRTI